MRIKINKVESIIILAGIALLIFAIIKALNASFTHDESFSYLNYVHTSFMDIISYKRWYTNNHILNTLLMKISEWFFGSSEISLRLPNLILFAVFMVYGYFLLKMENWMYTLGLFLLLCTNNSLVDLFGLARGYGLSFGFMLMSLYHFIRSFYGQQKINLVLFHIGSLFAILSNFTLLDFYLALLIIYNLMVFIDCKFISNKKYQFFASNKVNGICLLLVFIILYEPVRRVIMHSTLDFGGKNGFYADTVRNLIQYCVHGIYLPPWGLVMGMVVLTFILFIPFLFMIQIIRKKDEAQFINNRGLFISTLLMIFISVAIVLQHFLFGADYPISRFSLYLFPLFIVNLGFLLAYFKPKIKSTFAILFFGLALISTFSFIKNADFNSCSEWGYDMETKNMMQELSIQHRISKNDSTVVKLGVNWLFEPTANYYRESKKLSWLLPVNRDGLSPDDDYCYIFKNEIKDLNCVDYKVIKEFQGPNTVLVKITQHKLDCFAK